MTEIQQRLFALEDEKYRDFTAKLVPTVEKARIIGVRSPALGKLARELRGSEEEAAFLRALPHEYHEENALHGALITGMKDYGECIAALGEFLPYVNCWSVCDSMNPKCFRKHLPELKAEIRRWLDSGELYTMRFAMGILMNRYLDEAFFPEALDWVADIRSEEYYMRMMQAWYFATALTRRYDEALPYIEQGRLEKWTHNKTIQKAKESFRVSEEHKAYLNTLKR